MHESRPLSSAESPVSPANDLLGLAELAAMLVVTKGTARRYAARGDFLAPLGRLASGPVWRRAEVERWARDHLPLPPGRPRKPQAAAGL